MDAIINYFQTNSGQYIELVWEHVQVSVISVVIAAVIAIPLGILGSRYDWVEKMATGIAGAMRIIPSLAVLFILIPYMGTGPRLAIVALTILAIPPILINTVVGFTSVSSEVIAAAVGMGMDSKTLFWEIEVPLAFPTVFAGLRTSSIEVISNATLASYIGAGGLGNLIFTGLNALRMEFLIVGGVSVAFLSFLVGTLMKVADRRLRQYDYLN